MPKPPKDTHPSYFQHYIDLVPEEDLQAAFTNQLPLITAFLQKITEEKSIHAYAPGKWTIKELLQHMIDTERVFAFRSLCFARKEKASLPGFDENDYAANSDAAKRSWAQLVEEFLAVRKTTELLFKSFTTEALQNSGVANNNPATVASMGFTTLGHVYHHKKILEERYL
jgi:DinB superfamily